MAEKIKKFFAKKKADAKFKLAGPGRRLNDDSSGMVLPPKKKAESSAPLRTGPTDATRQAAEAALARISSQKKDTAFNTSLAAIQAKVRKELEAERKNASVPGEMHTKPKEADIVASPHLAVSGIYFKCPLISDEILSKEEWKSKIKEFLFNTLEEERGITACLIIYSCNYNRSKVLDCVNILCRYIDNIIANPTETKFHRIRCSNATFNDKVVPVLGATEFLYAAGFRQEKLENNGVQEDFWVWSLDNIDGDLQVLEFLRETLKSEDRVELELDRNTQVLSPSQAAQRVDLPQEFYAISPEEIKREQQMKAEMAEKSLQLRTKAMREKDELREGTFSVFEKLADVFDFVRENLEHEGLPFVLNSPTGHKFEEGEFESSLADLRLVPATILIFQWEASIEQELKAAGSTTFLKPEVMMLVQSI